MTTERNRKESQNFAIWPCQTPVFWAVLGATCSHIHLQSHTARCHLKLGTFGSRLFCRNSFPPGKCCAGWISSCQKTEGQPLKPQQTGTPWPSEYVFAFDSQGRAGVSTCGFSMSYDINLPTHQAHPKVTSLTLEVGNDLYQHSEWHRRSGPSRSTYPTNSNSKYIVGPSQLHQIITHCFNFHTEVLPCLGRVGVERQLHLAFGMPSSGCHLAGFIYLIIY